MNGIAGTSCSKARVSRGEVADAAFYTRVASIASTIDVSGALMRHCREAIDTVNKTIVWEKSLFAITMPARKFRKTTEYYHPMDPRRERQLSREKQAFRELWKREDRDNCEEPMSDREEDDWRRKTRCDATEEKQRKIRGNPEKEGERHEDWREGLRGESAGRKNRPLCENPERHDDWPEELRGEFAGKKCENIRENTGNNEDWLKESRSDLAGKKIRKVHENPERGVDWPEELRGELAGKKCGKIHEITESNNDWRDEFDGELAMKKKMNIHENEEEGDDDCECLGIATKAPVMIITLDDDNVDDAMLSSTERTSKKRGYEDDLVEMEKSLEIDSRSSVSSDRQRDSVRDRSSETPSSLIDECESVPAKRAKIDADVVSTIAETPELLDERVGNAAFLVRIPRAAITLNLNSYGSSSRRNPSPARTSPEIRLADSSVPDPSPAVDNRSTNEKCDSSTAAKKLKIIEDLTCLDGTILTTASLKKCARSAAPSEKTAQASAITRNSVETTRSEEKSLEEPAKNAVDTRDKENSSEKPAKSFVDTTRSDEKSTEKNTTNFAGAKRRRDSSERPTKSSIEPTKNVRIRKKLRTLFGSEETLTESDEERRLTSKLTPQKRRKESRMSSDSGVFLNDLTSDSMTPETHVKREDESAIYADELLKSMPSLDSAMVEAGKETTPQEALPDSSTSLEEKSSIRPDSSSCEKSIIPLVEMSARDVFDSLHSELDSSNETQISTTSCLPIVAPKIDESFDDLENLVSMDVKKGCRIIMEGNRISIQEDAAPMDEDAISSYNDDENPLVIDERAISDDSETAPREVDESSNAEKRDIVASADVEDSKKISSESQMLREEFVPRISDPDQSVLNTLNVDSARETTDEISSSGKSLSERQNRKDESIDENQNDTLRVTSPGATVNEETSKNICAEIRVSGDDLVANGSHQRLLIISATLVDIDTSPPEAIQNQPGVIVDAISPKNLPVLLPADKTVTDTLVEKSANAARDADAEIVKDGSFEELNLNTVQKDFASGDKNNAANKKADIAAESNPENPTIEQVAETIGEELPDSELPTLLVEPQKAKEIPKFRVLHPSELGSRWCPTPINANAAQLQLQQTSAPPATPSNPMAQKSFDPSIVHAGSLTIQPSYQLPLPTLIRTEPSPYQSNSPQQLSSTMIAQTSQQPSYSSIPQVQMLPATLPQTRQPPLYSSISRPPQCPPAAGIHAFARTPLDNLQNIVSATLPSTLGVQDLSYKNSATYRPADRRPSPSSQMATAPSNWYTRPSANFRQQSSATVVSSNPYPTSDGRSIGNRQSILFRICDLLLTMSRYRDRLDTEHEMYKVFQLRSAYKEKKKMLTFELDKYATQLGTRDRRIIVGSIVQYYDQLIEPGQRTLNRDKVARIIKEDALMAASPSPSPARRSLFTETQYRTLKDQIAIYRELTRVLYYQLLAQREAVAQAEAERLRSLEAAKPKRTRKSRAAPAQEKVVQTTVASPVQQMNYQQTIDHTIETIFLEALMAERANVPVNVNEGTVQRRNACVNSADENARERIVGNNDAVTACELLRQQLVATNSQGYNVESNARDKGIGSNGRDKTIESNVQVHAIKSNLLRNEAIESNVQVRAIERNLLRNEAIESNVQVQAIESNLRNEAIEGNVQIQAIESNLGNEAIESNLLRIEPIESNLLRIEPIESNLPNETIESILPEKSVESSGNDKADESNVKAIETEETAPIECLSERSNSSIEDGNTSVLDVLKEFEVLDSMTKKGPSKIPKTRKKVKASTESKKCSKETEHARPEDSPVPAANPAASAEKSDGPKTDNAEEETSLPKPAESVVTHGGSSPKVAAVSEVVAENDETAKKVPAISEVVETNDGSMREVPVITIDDDDDFDVAPNERASARHGVDVVESDEFSILEVKSISKDVFNNIGDVIDEMSLADRMENDLTTENDDAEECADPQIEDSDCFNCGRQSSVACEQCRSAFYCSTKCHKNHWSRIHHLECRRASKMSKDLKK